MDFLLWRVVDSLYLRTKYKSSGKTGGRLRVVYIINNAVNSSINTHARLSVFYFIYFYNIYFTEWNLDSNLIICKIFLHTYHARAYCESVRFVEHDMSIYIVSSK